MAGKGAGQVWGGPNVDRIFDDRGNDVVHGGDGNDFVQGENPGRDIYYLGAGGDNAVDGRGNDVYHGGESDDAFVVGRYGPAGTDLFFGGPSTTGNGVVYQGAGTFTADLLAGVTGGVVGVDTLHGVTVVVGGSGGNTLIGNDEGNRLYGGDGDDHIEGRGGDDLVWGGAGTDYLDGGDGTDGCTLGETVLNCEP